MNRNEISQKTSIAAGLMILGGAIIVLSFFDWFLYVAMDNPPYSVLPAPWSYWPLVIFPSSILLIICGALILNRKGRKNVWIVSTLLFAVLIACVALSFIEQHMKHASYVPHAGRTIADYGSMIIFLIPIQIVSFSTELIFISFAFLLILLVLLPLILLLIDKKNYFQ